MELQIGGSKGSKHYVVRDVHGTVVKNFHTNDDAFAQRTLALLAESYELLGGIRVDPVEVS